MERDFTTATKAKKCAQIARRAQVDKDVTRAKS